MFENPRDDWYDWRTAHGGRADAIGSWVIIGIVVMLFLVAPLA